MRRNLVHLDGAAIPHYYDYRISYLEQSTSSNSTMGSDWGLNHLVSPEGNSLSVIQL